MFTVNSPLRFTNSLVPSSGSTIQKYSQLRRSGYLDGVAGIVAGTFTGCGPPEAIQDILAERLGSLGVPMIAWANVGHGGLFQAFPYGIAAELDAVSATLRLLEPPLRPPLS